MTDTEFKIEKQKAHDWFRNLRDQIVAAFEDLEQSHDTGPFSEENAGKFEAKDTKRHSDDGSDAGGGLMSVMRGGRVFEKVGVNISTVYGTLAPAAQKAMTARKSMPNLQDDPRFWAAGISLVAHMQNPHVPAVHMNTRMFWTNSSCWFGGGADLNPCIEYDQDTSDFHAQLQQACADHNSSYYADFKARADEYFYIPHRKRARGVGGIFYDDLNTGDWAADFAFTQSVGAVFLPAFVPLVQRRRGQGFNDADKHQQLVHRGLYAEYNLVYDRGTKFGLETGHDPDAVLMSLPPLAKWV